MDKHGAVPFAAIDVGSTAIRLAIAETAPDGSIHFLERLQQSVNLGKDSFTDGRIKQTTIEECVNILSGFRRVMAEFGITSPKQIRGIATSAVREAENKDTFVDRLYIATGILIEPIEEAEENRLNYLAIRSFMAKDYPGAGTGVALVIEVGGGGTDLLLMEDNRISFANSFRLGSLRLRQTLEKTSTSSGKLFKILDFTLRTQADTIRHQVPTRNVDTLFALSGDMRFASSRLKPGWEGRGLACLSRREFGAFADEFAQISVDDLVRDEHLPYQEAETLGPALLAYKHLAKAFKVKSIIVPRVTLRDGLLIEMAAQGSLIEEFADQAIHSAISLGEKFRFDEDHARHVAGIAKELFVYLRKIHNLGPRFELLLNLAALLHDCGMFVSSRAHHKHSSYLILNSDLFGLSQKDRLITALVARYHRRAVPAKTHTDYRILPRETRLVISKLAAILRVADALDRNHLQNISKLTFSREQEQLIITIPNAKDLTLERLALKEKGAMFEDVYGMQIALRSGLTQGD